MKLKLKQKLNKDISIKKDESQIYMDHNKTISLKDIKENPELYIKVNIIRKNTIIDTTYVMTKNKKFEYEGEKYNVDESKNLHEPKGNYVIPTSYYTEGDPNQLSFKNFNTGIPAKILTLLFDPHLYSILINIENKSTNWILIILTIANIVLMGVVTYGLYSNGLIVF